MNVFTNCYDWLFWFRTIFLLDIETSIFCQSLATETYEHIGNDLLLMRLQIDRENVNHKYDNQ